jgi:two-component system, chemotaxis family, protein-glutamate methylesterase/glutaminase
LDVVGTARDGLDALAKIEELDPDVITLDLVMPQLDGLETLRALAGRARPKVVMVCMAEADSDLALSALAAGAVDIVHKPTALATERLYEVAQELVFKVESAAAARTTRHGEESATASIPTHAYSHRYDALLIGASTGGPQAVSRILRALPADFPIPIAVVIHLPYGFTQSYAERLNAECALRVVEAEDGGTFTAGSAVVARGGQHLKLGRNNRGMYVSVTAEPRTLHRPSVDQLFSSAAPVLRDRALGVVLTGMGDDGLEGARELRSGGAHVLVEAEGSCVVYGMPRVVWEAGLANAQHLLGDMASAILKLV